MSTVRDGLREARARARATREAYRPAWSLMMQGVVVLAGCVLIWFASTQAVPSWRAAHRQGRPGTFTITDVYCNAKGHCTRTGEFRSDDGRLDLSRTEVIGASGDKGQTRVAYYEGDSTRVYGAGWRGVTETAIYVALGIIAILTALAVVAERVIARRHPSNGRHARRTMLSE